jgi:outer membrane lipoprotein
MGLNHKIYFAEFLIIVFFVGCAHPVSQKIRKGIDADIKFDSLIGDPNLFLGKRVLFGGVIVVTRNLEDGTELEIVQKNLESYGNLEAGDYSGGRFLFFSKSYLDPEIYSSGRELIGVGKVTGKKLGKIGDYSYSFPIIETEELHLLDDKKLNSSNSFPPSWERWRRPYFLGRNWSYY